MSIEEENKYLEGDRIRVTVEWMSEHYEKANNELFGGMLGDCYFEARPLKPRSFGNFRMNVKKGELAYYNSTRRMFFKNGWNDIQINRNNFFDLCKPTITMNTLYTGTELSLYNTLVHEMCHYYTYMNGRIPAQGHGPEFREIASYVTYRGHGTFTVQRLASADEMEGYKLDDDVKVRTRKVNPKKNYYFIFTDGNDAVRMLNLSEKGLDDVLPYVKQSGNQTMVKLENPEIADAIYDDGYRTQSHKYRYWSLNRHDKFVEDALKDGNSSLYYQPE